MAKIPPLTRVNKWIETGKQKKYEDNDIKKMKKRRKKVRTEGVMIKIDNSSSQRLVSGCLFLHLSETYSLVD